MNIKSLSCFIFKATIVVVLVIPFTAYASTDECIKRLYKYGRAFTPEKLGPNITKKTSSKPNNNGEPGEKIVFTEYSSMGNWVTEYQCKSCTPLRGLIEVHLKPSTALPCGIKAGTTKNEAMRILGDPENIQGSILIYAYPPIEKNQDIRLILRNGKLDAIHWLFYLD